MIELRYGHYKMTIAVLYTLFEEKLFSDLAVKEGSFGSVHFIENRGQRYAVKSLEVRHCEVKNYLHDIYREYLLC